MRVYLIILAMIAFAPSIRACSCDTIPFESAIVADEIFLGNLCKAEFIITDYDYIDSIKIERGYWQYSFKVYKKWKGSPSDIAVVKQTMTTCAYPFKLTSKDYLVYSYYTDNNLIARVGDLFSEKTSETYLCTRNTGQYYSNSYDGSNWFDSDTAQLNKHFPVPVKLSSYPNFWGRFVLALVIMLTGFGLYRLIKKKRQSKTIAN